MNQTLTTNSLINNFIQEPTHFSEFIPDINIAFAVDKNYLKACGISIISIIKNNPNIKIDFYIFTSYYDSFGFSEIFKDNKNIRLNVYILNTENLGFENLQTTSYINSAMYYRLSIANILKDKVKSFIYLDADILCTGKINELVGLNLNNFILAAVQDKGITDRHFDKIKFPKDHNYFNSGMLYVNIEEWMKNDVINKFFNLIASNKYKFPDQDTLNLITIQKVLFLEQKFNFFSTELEKNNNPNPVFIHFVGPIKPWSVLSEDNTEFLKYYQISPWKNIPLDQPKNYREMRQYSKKMFKNGNIFLSIVWYLRYLNKKIPTIIKK